MKRLGVKSAKIVLLVTIGVSYDLCCACEMCPLVASKRKVDALVARPPVGLSPLSVRFAPQVGKFSTMFGI